MKKLFLGLVVTLSFFLVFGVVIADTKYTFKKTASKDVVREADPTYSLDYEGYKLGEGTVYIETSFVEPTNIKHNLYSYDLTYADKEKFDIEPKALRSYFRTYKNEYIFYSTIECVEGKTWICSATLNRLDKNLGNLKTLNVHSKVAYRFEHLWDDWKFLLEKNNLDDIVVDENGNFVFYADPEYYLVADKDFTDIEVVKAVDYPQYDNYFVDIKNLVAKNKSYLSTDGKKTTHVVSSYIESGDNKLYFGYKDNQTLSGEDIVHNPTNGYIEVIDKNGEIKKIESEKYKKYANPIIVDGHIVVRAIYDDVLALGTEKTDLLLLDENGIEIGILESDSYFNNLISYDDSFAVERIYVEGNCSAGVAGTYSIWNTQSCKVHHFYENYVIEAKETPLPPIPPIVDNPETRALSIALLVIITLGVGFYIIRNFKKMDGIRVL